MIDWFRNVKSKVLSRYVVRGVGVGVVNKVKDDLRRKRRTKKLQVQPNWRSLPSGQIVYCLKSKTRRGLVKTRKF